MIVERYISGTLQGDLDMEDERFVVTKKRKDVNKSITLRIEKDTLAHIDKIAAETNYSRSELLNILINYAMQNLVIETETT